MTDRRELQIDGLRGFCALFVMLNHSDQFGNTGSYTNLVVILFFAISGYLVNGTLDRRWDQESSPRRNFLLRRFFRIMPLWWLVLLFEFSRGQFDWKMLFLNASMLFGFFSFDLKYVPINASWSLFVEEIFYLIFPSLFLFLRKGPSAFVLFLSIGAAMAWSLLVPMVAWPLPAGSLFIFRFPIANFPYFLVGIIIYQLKTSAPIWERLMGHSTRSKIPWLDIAAYSPLVALPGMSTHHFALYAFAILTCSLTEGTWTHRILTNRFLRWCGVRCYGIYILHGSVYGFFRDSSWTGYSKLLPTVVTPTLITLGLAALLFRYLEVPAMQWGKSLIQRWDSQSSSKKLVEKVA